MLNQKHKRVLRIKSCDNCQSFSVCKNKDLTQQSTKATRPSMLLHGISNIVVNYDNENVSNHTNLFDLITNRKTGWEFICQTILRHKSPERNIFIQEIQRRRRWKANTSIKSNFRKQYIRRFGFSAISNSKKVPLILVNNKKLYYSKKEIERISSFSPIRMKIEGDVAGGGFLKLPTLSQTNNLTSTPTKKMRVSCRSSDNQQQSDEVRKHKKIIELKSLRIKDQNELCESGRKWNYCTPNGEDDSPCKKSTGKDKFMKTVTKRKTDCNFQMIIRKSSDPTSTSRINSKTNDTFSIITPVKKKSSNNVNANCCIKVHRVSDFNGWKNKQKEFKRNLANAQSNCVRLSKFN